MGVKIVAAKQGLTSSGKTKKRKALIYHLLPNTINFKKERTMYKPILLNTVWETSKVPKRWVPYINRFDAVCIPSTQNKKALINSGVKIPIRIVPHGVDTQRYKPSNKKMTLSQAKGKFVFVSVFGFQHRKNPETLLRAYWEEFSSADNVLLVIKTSGYARFENEQWIKHTISQYKKKLGIQKKTAPIVIITRHLDADKLKGIYTLGNAFVLPTRGEGVGLPFLEALASGTPVIATKWGGHMDFLTSKNSFLVDYRLNHPLTSMNNGHSISRKFRNLFGEKGQRWAEADRGSLKKQMRLAYKNPQLCKKKGQQGRQDVLKVSWDRAGRLLKKALEQAIRSDK
ncbi:glycosyltransferase family 4 protein [Paenibacillus sp. N3.4]|uniref:glycosyltransferase family 4 protein n=1 Tax=Paenibacillus sp. N3.4 TaxID=2603222 RepID=UPI0021C2AC7F|nr:glycosyltransferase family 4 protein [Paenibacillus sp. N3.4]